ncbi:CRISPR-associated protein Cas4 [Kyrpidia sp.]|uniref:CRISPR-associated protein Cas4 n=1 Tax=Kyrpidia sp. TaxID=2073077 RepID=UPI00258D4DCE|nr:CRISPR-associated protein Cas4 [Kyrpidia sp.]
MSDPGDSTVGREEIEWADEDCVPLSAIQHYSYCPRQYALIHIEQAWAENIYTAKGRWVHERVDEEGAQSQDGIRVLTGLAVWSDRYGLVGKCDRVEIRGGIPFPVEFKFGRMKASIHDELQLCGQALCLEEMFGVAVPKGAIYHVQSRHRREVLLDDRLRQLVLEIVAEIRGVNHRGVLPPAVNDKRCNRCSLEPICLPDATDGHLPDHWSDWPLVQQVVEERQREGTRD